MNVFISGGCKNGKSYYAQREAKNQADEKGKPLYYIATMIPHDDEDRARIARHLSEREGWGFETIEQGKNILEILKRPGIDLDGVFLLDSVTAIMENEMFLRVGEADACTETDCETGGSGLKGKNSVEVFYDESAAGRVCREMVDFAKATGSTVFVSDGIYGDMGEYSRSTEDYRKALAAADRALAEVCDKVVEISYGNEEVWKEKTD